MKKIFYRWITVFILCLLSVFCFVTYAFAEINVSDVTIQYDRDSDFTYVSGDDKDFVSREYAVAAFADAAGCFEIPDSDVLSSFTDAWEVSEAFAPKLAQAVTKGIIKGYEDNTLRPKMPIRRIEALVILARIMPEAEAVCEPEQFIDVSEWAKNSIDRLSAAGIVKGYGNGLLGSNDNLTAEQVEILTARVNGYMSAVYLGVENYGAEQTNKDNKNNFRYRFNINGSETILSVDNGSGDNEGNYDYAIQNILKENYFYKIKIDGDKVISAKEIIKDVPKFTPRVSGTAGEKTLFNFLKTAMEPVGTTLYIYGGGWNWQDDGSAVQARTIGVSPDWVRFFNEHDENFTYKERSGSEEKNPSVSYYPYGGYNEYYYAGLDCSGYVGWVLYNTFETENMHNGYVGSSTGISKRLAEKGFGYWTQDITAMKPGDIMSINGHVWISLGTCNDGSTVIVHSSPSLSRANQPGGGVQISAIGNSKDCEAYKLADYYMAEYYPEWYRRYPVYLCDPDVYFTFTGETAGKFTWSDDIIKDSENVKNMNPEEVLKLLFE